MGWRAGAGGVRWSICELSEHKQIVCFSITLQLLVACKRSEEGV